MNYPGLPEGTESITGLEVILKYLDVVGIKLPSGAFSSSLRFW
jgi:hypothetical protein